MPGKLFHCWFSVQKIVFLPKGMKDVIDTFIAAYGKVQNRPDFGALSAKRLGKYPMFVGNEAKTALARATSVPDSAKAFVKNWLKTDYELELKK